MTYIPPKVFESTFTCSHCGAIAQHLWEFTQWNLTKNTMRSENAIRTSYCANCHKYTLWVNDVMVFPDASNAPLPCPEMPDDVKKLYMEARSICSKSPRGAAALLRLAIQQLCIEIGEKGNKINDDIASLVKKGLPEKIRKALDIVRVTGNNAVHPGQIDVDDIDIVSALFDLINLIVEHMIEIPKKVNAMFDSLPESSREEIEKRDKK